MKKIFLFTVYFLSSINIGYCQASIIPLWEKNIPNYKKNSEVEIQKKGKIFWIGNVQEPTLEVFLPTKRNSTKKAVIICPGGGYAGLSYDWEGIDIAKWLNAKGIAAFVLKYRLPKSSSVIVSHKAPLQDAERAIKLVRHHAEKWNISKNDVGIMGFSAGGHLASTLGTHFTNSKNSTLNAIDSLSSRPDFMILAYPVITMQKPYTHNGSRNNLLGKEPTAELVSQYSNELQVTKNTPPTFIVHATDDKAVPVMNSILFYQALLKNGIETEMHIYQKGGHGFSLAIGKSYLQTWPDRLSDWLNDL